ncbi:MAG: peptidase [Nitrospiraceae bacterium]|nr:peptidase [Nitrospiraceae bacterium]|tara:strand:- start:10 stop:1353 length:1344 start_codon:yes stop_codon:yes gene_type:complete
MKTIDHNLAEEILKKAKSYGATDGDVVFAEGNTATVRVRQAAIETLSKAREKRLGLRIFVGKRSAVSSTSDLSSDALDRFIQDTCALATAVVEDPDSGLPADDTLAQDLPNLSIHDDSECTMDDHIDQAERAEAVIFPFDTRITNSEGAEFNSGKGRSLYANSRGFFGEYTSSSYSLSVSPIASEHGKMQRDSWYTVHRMIAGLEAPEAVGTEAARRAIRRLGARKLQTQSSPIVFDPESASSLLGILSGAVSGSSLYRDASYLKDKLGEKVAPEWMTIYDDGRMPGGLGSRPYDGEGLPTRRTTVVDRGVLSSYLLDTYSARKLQLTSTGNASRGIGSGPSVGATNFYAVAGEHTPETIIRSIKHGFYVTDMMGFGVNMVTGDFSRGAIGIWIENGELTYAVDEVTIAGNLRDMFLNIEMLGNDLTFRGSVSCPTMKISEMMIAGE